MEKSFCIPLLKKRLGNNLLIIPLALILFLLPSLSWAQKKGEQPKEYSGTGAAKQMAGANYFKERPGSPYPAFVRFNETDKKPLKTFFNWLKQTVKTNDAIDFKLIKQDKDDIGFIHYRYAQTYKQVPIENAVYILHVKNNMVQSFNGYAVDITEKLSAVADITEAQSLQVGLRYIGAAKYKWQDIFWENDVKTRTKDLKATYYPKGELCWYSNDVSDKYKLAYKFDIHSATPDKIQRIYIDAKSGALLQTLPLESNCTSATVNTVFNGSQGISTDKHTATEFRLRDDCQAANIRIRDWNSATCTSSPVEIQNTTNTWNTQNELFGGTVLWATKQSYLYWLNAQSRSGYNGSNGSVEGYINAVFSSTSPACTPNVNNASMSFSGGTLKVGLGSAGTLANSWCPLDIIGHEFTHAVTGSSAMLVYANESGALNESFSDIFGEATENYVTGSADWLVGANRSSGAIRSLSNPNTNGDPDTYLSTTPGGAWFTGTGDNGGVHTNSGVQNFWYYLLSVGGTGTNDIGNAYSVTGIGMTAASAIAARNLTFYLTSGSAYNDARTNAIQAAIDLYGDCSNVVKQTTNAWYAVGVGAQFFDATTAITSNYNGRDVSCFNSCNGSATVNVISGISPNYSWSNGANTPSVSGLCPGNYTVTVTNFLGLGCAVTKSVVIANTPQLNSVPAVTTNFNGYGVSCYGGSNGTANANPSGGTGAYTYLWSDGQTSNPAINLSAGNYSVSVTDANGCTAGGNITVTQPPQLTTSVAATSNYNGYNVRCNGGSDGTAQAYPVGGVAPYTYAWSNSTTANPATGLSAINYSVIVTDANGCTATANVTLTEPPPLTINAGSNKIVYFGYPDSSCTNLTATGMGGGVPPYTITWSTGSNNATINVCPAVTTNYTVTISDLNGCSVSDIVTVCAIDVRCGNKLDKVTICHRTGSASNPYQSLCLSISGAKNHFINHPTDQLAACGTVKVCNDASLITTSTVKAPIIEIPAEGTLYVKAFPNPFSSNASIRFMVHKEDRVELKLYDILGREQAIIYRGKLDAGKMYQVNFDGKELSKGIYFLKLTTGNGAVHQEKLIISR